MQKFEIVACELNSPTITFETGALAQQASGAVVVRSGDSVVFAAVVASKEPREGCDFLPLTVDYSEKTYAAGKIYRAGDYAYPYLAQYHPGVPVAGPTDQREEEEIGQVHRRGEQRKDRKFPVGREFGG